MKYSLRKIYLPIKRRINSAILAGYQLALLKCIIHKNITYNFLLRQNKIKSVIHLLRSMKASIQEIIKTCQY